MIFIDRSIPRGVAEAVRRMREDVIWLEDEFPHDVPDEEWLAVAGEKGLLAALAGFGFTPPARAAILLLRRVALAPRS